MATGEESDDETLGGAGMHARASGLADYFAIDEMDALRQAAGWSHVSTGARRGPIRPAPPSKDPPEELLGVS